MSNIDIASFASKLKENIGVVIKGKEEDPKVKEVFDFIVKIYNYENNEKFFPEKVFTDKTCTVKNYPANIPYGDMKNNTIDEKERLLNKWVY